MNKSISATKKLNVEELNAIFTPLPFKERISKLYDYFSEKEILYTSSFGTKSVFLLHLISQIKASQKVHFINTTYHFQETIDYRNQIADQFNLEVLDVVPGQKESAMTREEKWWEDHPKMCCTINKIAPLEPIIAKHSVWISGLMAYQTGFRKRLRVFEQQGDIIKFHPIVDIEEGDFLYHMGLHELPRHPLESQGFGSIGCTHCTAKGEGRDGRWKGKQKTECGLHPNFFTKKEK